MVEQENKEAACHLCQQFPIPSALPSDWYQRASLGLGCLDSRAAVDGTFVQAALGAQLQIAERIAALLGATTTICLTHAGDLLALSHMSLRHDAMLAERGQSTWYGPSVFPLLHRMSYVDARRAFQGRSGRSFKV